MFIEKGLEQRFRAFFKFLNDLCNGATAAVKFTVGAGKRLNSFFGKFIWMKPERMQIQGSVANGIAGRLGARGNVTVHLVSTTHKSVGTDLVALLNGGNATDCRIFTNTHMAAELAAVRDDDSRSDVAIMGDVRIGHYQHLIGHMGATAPLHRATVKRAVFTNGAIFANFKTGRLARVL